MHDAQRNAPGSDKNHTRIVKVAPLTWITKPQKDTNQRLKT